MQYKIMVHERMSHNGNADESINALRMVQGALRALTIVDSVAFGE